MSSSQQLLDLRCPTLWPLGGNEHYLVLCACLGSIKLSRLHCCWCNCRLWSEPWLLGSPHSNCFPPPSDIKTAAQPRWCTEGTNPRSSNVADNLADMLCWCLYSTQFPYRGHFSWIFQDCLNFVMILLLEDFLLKPRALHKAFIDFWRDTRREVLPMRKQVLRHWFI